MVVRRSIVVERQSEMEIAPQDELDQRRRSFFVYKTAETATPVSGSPSIVLAGTVAATAMQNGVPSAQPDPTDFFNCLRLSAENKITPKNAFSLAMIDFMTEAIKSKVSVLDNFQLAGSSLDAGTKIYACRVDHVAGNVAELSMGISAMGKHGGAQNNDDLEAETEGGSRPKKKAKKRCNILVNNVKELKMDMPKLSTQNTLFDLIGNIMEESIENFSFIERSNKGFVPGMSSEEWHQEAPLVSFKLPDLLEGARICPSFSNFAFLDPDRIFMPMEQDTPPVSPGSFAENENSLNHSWVTERNENETITENLGVVPVRAGAPKGLQDWENIRPQLSLHPSDFSFYNSNDTITPLLGPAFWRWRRPKNISTIISQSKVTSRKRIKPEITIINFETTVLDLEKLRSLRGKTSLTRETMLRWCPDKTTLPTNVDFNVVSLLKCVLTPLRTIVRSAQKQSPLNIDASMTTYNYNNGYDKENYCPAPLTPVEKMPVNLNETLNQSFGFTQEIPADFFEGNELLPAPENLVATVMPNWKPSKRVNMKKLEGCLWKQIVGEKEVSNNLEGEWNLQTLRKYLPAESKEAVSVASTLYALLNLANKHELEIEVKNDMFADLRVRPVSHENSIF